MTILIDTSAIYALVDADDVSNVRAADCWNDLLDRGDMILASSCVVSEAVSLLHARLGIPAVRMFAEKILPALSIDWADLRTQSAVLGMLLATEGKSGPSFTDLANMEAMGRLDIRTIFAYDRHYETAGLHVIG